MVAPPDLPKQKPAPEEAGANLKTAEAENYPKHHEIATDFGFALAAARLELAERIEPWPVKSVAYFRQNDITVAKIGEFVGAFGITPIADFGGGRFDFAEIGPEGFVFEAFGADGVTIVDLIGWPIDRPQHVLSMFGRLGLLNGWEAFGPATYYMDGALTIHRKPLDWLKAGCSGSAIVTPHIAARQLLDLPGKIVAADLAHGRDLQRLARSVVRDDLVLVRRAA